MMRSRKMKRIDTRVGVITKVMKFEILFALFGIVFAFGMPFYFLVVKKSNYYKERHMDENEDILENYTPFDFIRRRNFNQGPPNKDSFESLVQKASQH